MDAVERALLDTVEAMSSRGTAGGVGGAARGKKASASVLDSAMVSEVKEVWRARVSDTRHAYPCSH